MKRLKVQQGVFFAAAVLFVCSILAAPVEAQTVQRLTVTPPLYQLSIAPGTLWQSTLKVVNSNAYPLTIYTEVVNFAPDGEAGQGMFIPVNSTDRKTEEKLSLAEWINISRGPFVIESEKSLEIPFFVELPSSAAPGGHYAAILVSTEPPSADGKVSVLTTQTITSLLFTRVEGEVIESANIREFSTSKTFLSKPEVEFSLRIENKGNIHVQPRGNIIVSNMWGTERGVIPINSQGQYGNVLPASIRDFRYVWSSEHSLTDIGRYKAEATFGYGQSEIQNVSSVAYFWVLPVKGALITLASLITTVLLIAWMMRLYVRRMLTLAGVPLADNHNHKATEAGLKNVEIPRPTRTKNLTLPIRSGSTDLKNRLEGAHEFIDVIRTLLEFVGAYKRFFIAIAILIMTFIALVYYIGEVTTADRSYEVRVKEGGEERILIPADKVMQD